MSKDDKKKEKRPTLREKMLDKLAAEGFEEEDREVTVMARMNKKVVQTLDSLVALGIFKSRSEAAAALVESAMSSSADLFAEIREQASSLERRKDEAVKSAQEAVLEKLE
ncbi:MAG: hypothetical protein ACFFEF_06520 [Candidatus Thorarchaeota archaeon]